MKRLIEIKKDLRGEGISYRSFVQPMEGLNKNIIINIAQIEQSSQEKNSEKRLTELIEILFDTAAKAEERYYDAVLRNHSEKIVLYHELKALMNVIKRAGLYEGYKSYRDGGYSND